MSLSIRVQLAVGAFSFCTLVAHAQTTPTEVTPAPVAAPAAVVAAEPLLAPARVPSKYEDYLNKRYAADKEARAAVHMYARKRTGGLIWLLGGGAFVGYLASQQGTTTTSTGTRTVTVSPLGYVIFGGLPLAIAIGKFTRFNRDELYKMLLEYDKTHALPGYVVAKLNKSDYL